MSIESLREVCAGEYLSIIICKLSNEERPVYIPSKCRHGVLRNIQPLPESNRYNYAMFGYGTTTLVLLATHFLAHPTVCEVPTELEIDSARQRHESRAVAPFFFFPSNTKPNISS